MMKPPLTFAGDEGDSWVYRFGELVFQTDKLDRPDQNRVIALGAACGIQMQYIASHPELVRGKNVLEPFSGSGPLGIVALALGAERVTFVDINSRAMDFLLENIKRNNLPLDRISTVVADFGSFQSSGMFDAIFANPPFVATPEGVVGALHSEAGVDGNGSAEQLLNKLPALLEEDGQALLYLIQIESEGIPTILTTVESCLPRRPVELTKGFRESKAFEEFVGAYAEALPHKALLIEAWASKLRDRFGGNLTMNHYVVHIGAESDNGGCAIRDYDGTKYGEGHFRRFNLKATALENFVQLYKGSVEEFE